MIRVDYRSHPSHVSSDEAQVCGCEGVAHECVHLARIAASVTSVAIGLLFGAVFATTGHVGALAISAAAIIAGIFFWPGGYVRSVGAHRAPPPVIPLPGPQTTVHYVPSSSFVSPRSVAVPIIPNTASDRVTVGSRAPEVAIVHSTPPYVPSAPAPSAFDPVQRAYTQTHRPSMHLGPTSQITQMPQEEERVSVGSRAPAMAITPTPIPIRATPSQVMMPPPSEAPRMAAPQMLPPSAPYHPVHPAALSQGNAPDERVQVGRRAPAMGVPPQVQEKSPTDRVPVGRK